MHIFCGAQQRTFPSVDGLCGSGLGRQGLPTRSVLVNLACKSSTLRFRILMQVFVITRHGFRSLLGLAVILTACKRGFRDVDEQKVAIAIRAAVAEAVPLIHLRAHTQAPFGLAMTEAAVMLLLYFVAVPGALVVRRPLLAFHYAFARSLEDVVALSLLRAAAVTFAYWSGAGAKRHRCAPCTLITTIPATRLNRLFTARLCRRVAAVPRGSARCHGMLRICAWATPLQKF